MNARERQTVENAARHRAKTRLAERFPDEFAVLLDEERAARGLPPRNPDDGRVKYPVHISPRGSGEAGLAPVLGGEGPPAPSPSTGEGGPAGTFDPPTCTQARVAGRVELTALAV